MYSRNELFWLWTIVFGVSSMFQLTVSCSEKLGFKWRVNTRKYLVSVYPKWIHILCASIHVCFTSLSIYQCWAVLSLPKQEPAGQGQVYRPLTGGSHKNKEPVLSWNSWFSKTQKIGQIMYTHEPPVLSENPPVLWIFPKSKSFHKVFYSEIKKKSWLEVITYNKIKELPNIGTHLRL